MIVGWVTWSGRLLCAQCVHQIEEKMGVVNLDNCTPVEKDSQPHAFEKCDKCGMVVNNVVIQENTTI